MIRNTKGEPIGAKSVHGTCSVFNDEEILRVHRVIKKELFKERFNNYGRKEKVYIDFTQNNKAIIQQQATRGCTAATAAMLIKDQGGKPKFCELQGSNLGDDESIKQDIQNAGFKLMVTSLISNSLEDFREQLKNYGSAIVSLEDPQAGGHSIVVDEVSEDLQQVRLRDPYHGWEITVSAEAFQLRWSGGNVIQIENETSISKKGHLHEKALKARSNFWRES